MTFSRKSLLFVLAATLCALCSLPPPAAAGKWIEQEVKWRAVNASNYAYPGRSDTLYAALPVAGADDTTGAGSLLDACAFSTPVGDSVVVAKFVIATDTTASVAMTTVNVVASVQVATTPRNWSTIASQTVIMTAGARLWQFPIYYNAVTTISDNVIPGGASMIMPNIRLIVTSVTGAPFPMARAYLYRYVCP